VLNAAGDAEAWVQQYKQVYLPIAVVGELRFGALNSQHVAENLARIDKLIERCSVLDLSLSTTMQYASVRLQLKRSGTPIPENDVWIAAICMEQNTPLASSDLHFAHVQDLEWVRR
jgi:tRNA(fMet)-specific endonuclease VapC